MQGRGASDLHMEWQRGDVRPVEARNEKIRTGRGPASHSSLLLHSWVTLLIAWLSG